MEKHLPPNEKSPIVQQSIESAWSTQRIYKNLAILSCGFLLLFTGENGVSILQSTLNQKSGIGVVSQAIIYATFALSSLLLPKITITRFGCKKVLVVSMLLYCPYIASNFHMVWWNAIPSSLLNGIAAGTLWTSECTYLNRLCRLYYNLIPNKSTQTVTTALLFGLFGMFYLSTRIWGSLISFFILGLQHSETSSHADNVTSQLCGIQYSETDLVKGITALPQPSDHIRYLLTGLYVLCALLSVGLVAIYLEALPDTYEKTTPSKWSNNLIATITFLRNTNQLLLIFLPLYIGLSEGFFLGDFTKVYVACSWSMHYVSLVGICNGIASTASSLLSGRMVKYWGRPTVMLTGAVTGVTLYSLLFFWKHDESAHGVIVAEGILFGLVYGTLWSQAKALYGVIFHENEEAAFGNFTLWISLGYSLSFSYSNFLHTSVKLYILMISGIAGFLGYIVVEVKQHQVKKRMSNSANKENYSRAENGVKNT